ncbi:MAG: hypothetical protein GXO47_08945 [Chlorobi bacterium]|nr:hypothetical protein [Chlorobiota bacterium]
MNIFGKERLLLIFLLFIVSEAVYPEKVRERDNRYVIKNSINTICPLTEVDARFKQMGYFRIFNNVYSKLTDIADCEIKIKGKKLRTTMASRPTVGSVLRRRERRIYVIVFNTDTTFKGVRLKDIPPDVLYGLFAHELMHVRDYRTRNFFGLAQRGFQRLSKKGKRKYEHEIDEMTIEAGFGKELYKWSYFVLNNSGATEDYKKFKRDIYMTPDEILEKTEALKKN